MRHITDCSRVFIVFRLVALADFVPGIQIQEKKNTKIEFK